MLCYHVTVSMTEKNGVPVQKCLVAGPQAFPLYSNLVSVVTSAVCNPFLAFQGARWVRHPGGQADGNAHSWISTWLGGFYVNKVCSSWYYFTHKQAKWFMYVDIPQSFAYEINGAVLAAYRLRVVRWDDLLQRAHRERLLDDEHALGQVWWHVLQYTP